MKLSLKVLTPGKMQGKAIPITLSQFLIGRDPQCHLRPASVLISNRHCVITSKAGQVFVRDLQSTNGTTVNQVPIEDEVELCDRDILCVGPISFEVNLETPVPVDQPTPVPPTRTLAPVTVDSADEDAAAMLLSAHGEPEATTSNGTVDDQGVPVGSTIVDGGGQAGAGEAGEGDDKQGAAGRHDQAKKLQADTSVAAKALLSKYLRRRN